MTERRRAEPDPEAAAALAGVPPDHLAELVTDAIDPPISDAESLISTDPFVVPRRAMTPREVVKTMLDPNPDYAEHAGFVAAMQEVAGRMVELWGSKEQAEQGGDDGK